MLGTTLKVADMTFQRFRAATLAAALAGTALLGAAGSAQAAVYTGVWDPAYGAAFPGMGWTASGVFNVPDACVADPDAASCGFSITSMKLNFYDTDAPDVPVESIALNTNVHIDSLVFSGSTFVGINTSYFAAVTPTSAVAGGGDASFSLILYNGTQAQLLYVDPSSESQFCGVPGVSHPGCGFSATSAVGTITAAVPEPGTYALMAGGLGVLAWVARRRQRGA